MEKFIPTNTLAMGSFDVLKVDGVEDPLINMNTSCMDFEESYFIQATRFIQECDNLLTESKIKLYTNIRESAGDQMVVLEGFSEFFSSIKDIIDKFLKFIKSLFDRFVTEILKLVGNDKHITKKKALLSKFKTEDEFEFTGYTFTFKYGVPIANAISDFSTSLFGGSMKDLPIDSKELDADSFNKMREKAKDQYDEMYDRFRAHVLGREDRIYSSDFSEELFREFRDGDLDTSEFTVDSSKVNESLRRFENYKDTKKTLEKERREIEKSYNNIKKMVGDIAKRNNDINVKLLTEYLPDGFSFKDGVDFSSVQYQIDLYAKEKCDQIQQYSNIHVLAYSAKLDALKACYIQDRNMLYTALGRVQRTDKKRGER